MGEYQLQPLPWQRSRQQLRRDQIPKRGERR